MARIYIDGKYIYRKHIYIDEGAYADEISHREGSGKTLISRYDILMLFF